jgi:hypothetical protein
MLETAMATCVISVAIVAVLNLLAAGTSSNAESAQLTTGMNLAQNVREMYLGMTPDELLALSGKEYSPPVDAGGEEVKGYDNWTQRVDVSNVDIDMVSATVPSGSSPAVRVNVTIRQGKEDICKVGWLTVQVE